MNLFSFIKQRVPILQVVGEYASLKKAGHYWKGCCPFHHERTASFTVSPDKEIFYCFGCHTGGDVISFVAKMERCSPIEAAHHLVERHSIQLPADIAWDKKNDQYELKKSYQQTCSIFARWCRSQLEKSPEAQAYLQKRHITPESIQAFSLGYCSSNVKSLLTFAQKEGFLAQNFIDAHIIKEGKLGLYIAFDERIIFPISDHLGTIVGFGGRIFKEGDERAKYYNSHDHAYFNKGSLLFGLDKAKKGIEKKSEAFLVEGYTDLIMMHQYGYTNAVATLGTACTPEHLKHLARYAEKIFIMYDGDAAGQQAILRLTELCWQVSLEPYVLLLPPEDDPASFLLKQGTLAALIDTAQDIFTFAVVHASDNYEHKTLQGKMAATKKILELISSLADPLTRELLLQRASEVFSLPVETLRDTIKALHKPAYAPQEKQEDTPQVILVSPLEKKLFYAILTDQGTLTELDKELLSLLLDHPLKKIFACWASSQSSGKTDLNEVLEKLDESEKVFVTHCIASEALMTLEEEKEFASDDLTALLKKQWKKKIHAVKLKIEEAEKLGKKEEIAELLTDLNRIKTKMVQRGIS